MGRKTPGEKGSADTGLRQIFMAPLNMGLNVNVPCNGATAVRHGCPAPSRNSSPRYSRLPKQQLSIVCKAQVGPQLS